MFIQTAVENAGQSVSGRVRLSLQQGVDWSDKSEAGDFVEDWLQAPEEEEGAGGGSRSLSLVLRDVLAVDGKWEMGAVFVVMVTNWSIHPTQGAKDRPKKGIHPKSSLVNQCVQWSHFQDHG